MMESTLMLYIIKLALGGIAAFLAILLWSKTRDAAWMALVAGVVTQYAGVVYAMLVDLGIVLYGGPLVLGVPLLTMLFSCVPTLFYIIGFILMVFRNRN